MEAAGETEPHVAGEATSKEEAPLNATATDLFNRQVDLQKIEFLANRVQLLQSENESLRARHAKREQETHEFVSYFQKEIQTRDRQLTRLTEELAAGKLSHALELEATGAAKDAVFQQLHQSFASKEESFTEQVFFLKDELQQLEVFRDMKETVQSKMKELESALHKETEQGHERVRDLERRFLEEKARLQKEHEKRIEIVKQQAKEDARNGLDADTRKIVTDNRRMGEELRFQLQTTEELQREKRECETRAKRFAIETQLASAKEHEYARQAERQAREIKQLRATVKALEKTMSESLAAAEREKRVEVSKSGRELEDLALDADGLRRLLRLKNKELRNLRRLAQTVLDQRTDVEQFFLDALAHVKRELEDERKRQRDLELERYHVELKRSQGIGMRTGAAATSVRFPRLETPTGPARDASIAAPGARHFSEKVDLRQLTWEERERVLRLVFAKINGAHSYAQDSEQQPSQPPLSPSSSRSGSLDGGTRGLDTFSERQNDDGGVYFATEPVSPVLRRDGSGQRVGSGAGSDSASGTMSLSGLPVVLSPPHKRSSNQ